VFHVKHAWKACSDGASRVFHVKQVIGAAFLFHVKRGCGHICAFDA
jgi:hypothetical protein